jgi:hypothetical protein
LSSDEEARNDKKDVNADEATRKPTRPEVIDNNEQNGNSP